MVMVYMPLLNEGTDVWRPVEVTPLYGGAYRVEGPMPPDEEWAFAPGTLVDIRWRKFGDGEPKLVPIRNAFPKASFWFTTMAIVASVTAMSALPFTTSLNWIAPQSPYSTPYLAAWAAAAAAAYFRWREVQMVRETAGLLALGFSVVAILALFA